MKKSILYFLTAIMLFAVSCSESYDDSALVGRVDNLENRVAKLEELCKQMNTNISSLQTLVNALQNNDYVTGVTPITKNGETIGYTITFTKSQPITIYHGEDGKDGVNGTDGQDGHTPVIGVKQDTDGIYYWTLDGDWLLDDVGNKIKAQGTDGQNGADGKDGQDGADGKDGEDGVDGVNGTDGKDGINGTDGKDGITPQLKIENDYWYISYDNGKTWTQLGKATGEDGQNGVNGTNGTNGVDGIDGDSFFQGVDTSNDDYVIFTLADGTELVLPRHKNLSISFDIANGAACMPSASIKVGYKLTGADSGTTIETIGDGGWKSVVTKTSISSGYITVTAPESGGDGKVVMLATTSNGFTAMKSITFEQGIIMDISDTYNVNYENSTLKVVIKTNLDYSVSVPEEAQSWISVADTRATMRTETLTFTIKENPEENPARSATIKLIGECGDILQSFVIMQDYQPSSNPIAFADANVKRVCVEKFDTNEDGELSEKEAAAATSLTRYFFGDYKSVVTSFDELRYFVNLTTIPDYCFDECSLLTSVIIPEKVVSIKSHAFANCPKLAKIHIPQSLNFIASSAFYLSACDVHVADLNRWLNVELNNDSDYSVPMSNSHKEKYGKLWLNGELVKNCTLPEGLTKMDTHFMGCQSIEEITLSKGIVTIGANAFGHCSNLSDIIMQDGVISIESYAFMDCSSLKSISFPASVVNISSQACRDCSNLTTVYLKNQNPATMGDNVFYGCENLHKIYVPASSINTYKSADGWKDYADKIVGYDFEKNTEISYNQIWYEATEKVIPDGYAGFGANIISNTYENGNGVITFDGDVTLIGNSAFIECESLTSITIPESVTDIADYAFYNCSSLKSVYCKQTTPPTLGTSVFFNNVTGRKFYVPKASVNSYKVADGWKDYAYDIVGYDF